MLASDDANPQFANPRNPDDILFVQFYMKAVKDNFQSEKQGKPVFVTIPYVKIMTPGSALNIIDTEVRHEHKIRFPRQWAQFQNSTAPQAMSGVPLEEWPAIERSRAEELKAQRFFTVEQLAECSDLQLQSIGMDGYALREKAKAYLARAKDSAFANAQAAELAKRDEQIKAMQAEMAQMREMVAKATQGQPQPAKRRGRPPRQQQETPPSG